MNKDEQDKLISKEIKELLIKMHNGESLILTLNKIRDTINGIKYLEERKFIYMLQGLQQKKISSIAPIEIDANYLEGFNEAVEENNFAVKLAVNAVLGEQ